MTRTTYLSEELADSIAETDLGLPNVRTISVFGKITPSRIGMTGNVFTADCSGIFDIKS